MLEFRNYFESSYEHLYQSAVDAFPNTTKRQHVTGPIQISNISMTPFLGLNTLLIRADAQNESRQYKTVVLFKDVNYVDGPGITIQDTVGSRHFIEKLTADAHDILVRCNCKDFYWRGNYADFLDHSLFGRKRTKYEALHNPGSVNPTNAPMLCKHLMKLGQELIKIGIMD